MRKQNYLTIFLILFAFCVKSQTSKLELGVHAGINLGSLHGDDANFHKESKKNFYGGVAGLSLSYRISNNYAIRTAFQFEQNALIFSDITLVDHSGYPYGKGDEITKLSYLNVPITCSRSFGKRIRLNVNGGVFIGILAREKEITIVKQRFFPPGQSPTYETFKSEKKYYQSTNFGFSMGAGVSFPLSKKIKLDVNLQDCLGVKNIVSPKYNYGRNNATNSLSLTTGIIIRL